MQRLNKSITHAVDRPVKVMQFGEGNFLRAFVDYIFDVTNEKTDFNGGVVIVKPIEFGTLERFHDQECQYTLQLRGFVDGQPKEITRQITSVVDAVAAIEDYDKYVEYGTSETLRFIVSNTTEAGIVFDETDNDPNARPPKTYPGKLTQLLYKRYQKFNGAADKGLILLPCELIADNGIELKKCIMKFIELWGLEDGFKDWVNNYCSFCPTLVDRIVPGYPREDAAKLCEEWGYEDQLIDRAEVFGLWVVESDSNLPLEQLEKELPFKEAGLNVVFTKDHHPYKERKVRILNEVIPTLSLSKEDCEEFAKAVIDRFLNPFVDHRLLSISLNSVSKWEARCLPSFLGYVKKFNKLPKYLTFSIAALMSFYTSQTEAEFNGGIVLKGDRNGEEYNITDDKAVLDFFRDNSGKTPAEFTHAYLSNTKFFGGEDLSKVLDLEEVITGYITDIRERGMRAVVDDLALDDEKLA